MSLFKPIKLNPTELLRNAGIAVGFGFLMTFVIFQEQGVDIIPNIVLNTLLFFFLSSGYGTLVESINISWIDFPQKRLLTELGLTAIYIGLVAFLSFLFIGFVFYDPTFKGVFAILNWRYFFMVFTISYFFGLIGTGHSFLSNWKQAEIKAAKLSEAQAASRFESLKNQVNPHFLFNSLNVLTTLVYKDQDLAAKYIKQLSNTYRYVLESNSIELISVSRELQALESYIFLLKIRFGEGFKISIDLPETDDMLIAPLTLQMLVENAIKHNTVDESKVLHIQITADGTYLIIKNNLQKKNNQAESIGIGLENIKKRYEYLADQKVIVEETTNYFAVSIPIIERET